jgi:UDP-N-acetylmuramate: L-alanyl-gamma-D-glutamyl-meso-diaminopimelate ligase
LQSHLHILGICGTFMGGLALLARELGLRVTGSDRNVYPPMSDQLRAAGIDLYEGYDEAQFAERPDLVVIGNALSRGNPAVEYVLNEGIAYTSGAQWLAEHVLHGRWVLAVSGTHGKTTTSSLLAWLLDDAGMAPGFLIGGVPGNFGVSARLGGSDFFVVEADEYDTAFFDKRSKFVHYRPRTLVINNLEFDHADIFPDLAAIQRQFHHLLRCVPGNGRVLYPAGDAAVAAVLDMGCWSDRESVSLDADADWQLSLASADGSRFALTAPGEDIARDVSWSQLGAHNAWNAAMAVAAARHVGVPVAVATESLTRFAGVRRRLELRGTVGGVRVFDDFAHHPTAIAVTLQGLRSHGGEGKLLALIEPRSNTMRMGQHRGALADSVAGADAVYWYQPPGLDWSLEEVVAASAPPSAVLDDVDALAREVAAVARPGDQVVVMSNGGFGGIHERLLEALAHRPGP